MAPESCTEPQVPAAPDVTDDVGHPLAAEHERAEGSQVPDIFRKVPMPNGIPRSRRSWPSSSESVAENPLPKE